MNVEQLTDEDLIERSRQGSDAESGLCLDELYRRFYPKVAYWCLQVCGSRERAADLAQEVFLRVHSRLDSFRAESRFSTWLYQVTRSVAINQGRAARRREADSLDEESAPVLVDPSPGVDETLERSQIADRFKEAMARDLEPLEAQILYLHYADGLTVDGITVLLGLENKSGAKAQLVSAKRKLKRRFGRWLASQSAGAEGVV